MLKSRPKTINRLANSPDLIIAENVLDNQDIEFRHWALDGIIGENWSARAAPGNLFVE